MTQVINRMGDAMLTMLLPHREAGAYCCPNPTICEQCHLVDSYCGGDCKTHFQYYKRRYNCSCSCAGALEYCYTTTGGYCC